MSEKTTKADSIAVALIRIQQELKAPKGQYNEFANFNYRSCEDILEAVKPLLKNCFLIIQDEIVLIGERYYVKATVSLSNGSESIVASAFARESQDKKGMDDAQITGATSSYARKYALNGLFAIDDTKDADVNVKKRKVNAEKLLTGKELKALAGVLQNINNAKTVKEIEKVGATIKTETINSYNKNQVKVLRQAYDGKKKTLKK